jgi:hypothetical protein
MTKHLAIWALLGASVLNWPTPAHAQQAEVPTRSWSCDSSWDYNGTDVARCTINRQDNVLCVLLENRGSGEWTHRLQIYTYGSHWREAWGRIEAVVHRDGTVVPHISWWTRATRELHGELSSVAAQERMREMLTTYCAGEGGLSEARAIALRSVRTFSERVQHAEGSAPEEASRP